MIWLVQINLGHHQDYVMGIKQGCEESGNRFIGFRAVPFSGEAPACDGTGKIVAYGSVDVIHATYQSGLYNPGVFYNEDFRYSKYIQMLGTRMLNEDSGICTLEYIRDNLEEVRNLYAEDGCVFIRPDKDLKEFIGEVIDLDELNDWIDRIDRKRTLLSTDVKAVVARPYTLSKEWRAFLVGGEIVSICRYKVGEKVDTSATDLPLDMLEFVQEAANEWTPHPVCVMDVCETGGEYYIVEFNCFNSSGFYKNNIPLIARKISKFVEKIY